MRTRTRFAVAALLMPAISSSVGVDGGAVFQIAAVENLGLDAEVVGIAFGLGVLSVPVQLLAARMPLWRARRNLRLFVVVTAVECAVLAALLVTVRPGDRLAYAALVVAVLAEINVSVLFATSWQPLLGVSLAGTDRQVLASRVGAVSGLVRAGAALLFGALLLGGRVAYFAVSAAAAAAVAVVLGGVAPPDRPPPDEHDAPRAPVPPGMRPLYVAIGLTAAGAWPLFVVYVDDVLWPDVNLGLVAAVQLAGSLLAAALWRATTADVAHRARWAAVASLAAAASLAALPAPVDGAVEQMVFFASLTTAAAATSMMMLTVMELAHRAIDPATSVRAMTVYDVVASTSMQVGLLAAGFLVAASAGAERADPYRLYLVALALITLVVTARLSPPRRGRRRAAAPGDGAVSGLGLRAAAPLAPRPPEAG